MTTYNVYKLTEVATSLITAAIQTGIQNGLSDISNYWHDGISLELPQTYLNYASSKGYRKPVIYVIPESMSFQQERGANHINALFRINVSCVVEERIERLLNSKAWRYQCAIVKLLHLKALDNTDHTVRVIPKVMNVVYSPTYSEDTLSNGPEVFCKEVLIELDVEHYEKLYGG